MTLIKWRKPETPMMRNSFMMPAFDNIIEKFFRDDFFTPEFSGSVPPVNISETEKSYRIEMSVPGFNKDQIKVEVEDGNLVISGTYAAEKEEKEMRYLRKEFSGGAFRRSFSLDDSVDTGKITAKYESGMLIIEIAKKDPGKNSSVREIKIS